MIFTEWNWEDAFRVWKEEDFAAGLEQGKLEGEQEKTLEDICNLMETLHLSVEQAMDALKIPREEQEKYKKMLQV